MGCPGCGEVKVPNTDSRGNRIAKDKDRANEIAQAVENTPYSLSYKDYLVEKEQTHKYMRAKGDETVMNFPVDYKRIQIQELVDIYNLDEVARLSPLQALRALWEFANHPVYQEVFEEFVGLKDRVNELYEEVRDRRINLQWVPKNT